MQTVKANKFLLTVINPGLMLTGALIFFYLPAYFISLFPIFGL